MKWGSLVIYTGCDEHPLSGSFLHFDVCNASVFIRGNARKGKNFMDFFILLCYFVCVCVYTV